MSRQPTQVCHQTSVVFAQSKSAEVDFTDAPNCTSPSAGGGADLRTSARKESFRAGHPHRSIGRVEGLLAAHPALFGVPRRICESVTVPSAKRPPGSGFLSLMP